MSADATPREERRVITVLFTDLVGFTEWSEEMDPEDVRGLLTTYYGNVRKELERHGGLVDKFIGDAVMAVFGAPVAHEDDPERAVRAALAICEWAQGRDDLSLRVGVNTGPAFVGLDPSSTGIGIVAGDMVNTAARIQSAAANETVLVGEATYRATRDVFEYEEREPIVAKGKTAPVRIWEAVGARVGIGERRRLGVVPLVGREHELTLLRTALERTGAERSPQLVTLVGVPGIGKSRLVWELEQIARATNGGTTWLEGRSLPYGTGQSFWGLGELVKAHAGIMETDDAADAAAKLRVAVESLMHDPSDARWLEGHLRPLVGLAAEGSTREDGRSEALAAWRRYFELLAERAPLVLALDDLHWADDAVLAFLEDLVAQADSAPILVVGTARPELLERHPDWGRERQNATTIALSPLTDDETMELVRSLAGKLELAADSAEALLRRAGGNPLYAEEFVRMAADGGRSPDASLPESVQGIIAARLDVLSLPEKELLQISSVVGQGFWAGALAHVGNVERADVLERLDALERKEFVRRTEQSTVAGEPAYAFRHPLIREVAYEQIPRARRAGMHRLTAEWIESLPADRAEDRSEMLAHHYLRAIEYLRAIGDEPGGLQERAARALREAGDHARALHSFDVAAEHYRTALSLAEEDGELSLALAEVELRAGAVAEARSRLEGVLERARHTRDASLFARAALARGGVGITVGEADPALVALLEETLELLGEDDRALRARLLARLAVEVYYVPPPSRRNELSAEAVRLAREEGSPEALADALNARHAALWSPIHLEDRLAVAHELVELVDRIGDRERSLQSRTWLVLDLVESGDMDGARRVISEYARLAEPLGIPAYSWWIPAWEAMLAVVEGRFDDARQLSAQARETGERVEDFNPLLYWEVVGWQSDFEQGRSMEPWLPMIHAGIARGGAAGAYTCGLALSHAQSGRYEEARQALAQLGPSGLADVTLDMNWYSGASQYALAIGLLQDPEEAAKTYPLLLPYANRNFLVARAATVWGPAAGFLGLLAATAGLWEEAETHLEAAISDAEQKSMPLHAARARHWYAEMLRARGAPGDAERADELAAEAEAAASELGLELAYPAQA